MHPQKNRPVVITIFCVLMAIGAGALALTNLMPSPMREINLALATWYPAYLVALAAVTVACALGIWKMKSWAFIAYMGVMLINQIVLLYIDYWDVGSLIVLGAFGGLLVYFYPRTKQSRNLSEQVAASDR